MKRKSVVMTMCALVILTLTLSVSAQDKKFLRGTIEEVKDSSFLLDSQRNDKVEVQVDDSSWLRCEYKMPEDEIKDGLKICAFGKPDKETNVLSTNSAFVMMNEDDHYGWATKGSLLIKDGKQYIKTDEGEYELQFKGSSELMARYKISMDELKAGQDVSMRVVVVGDNMTVDYLTVDGNVFAEKEDAE
ncbi:MAG: hypothetical protein ACLFUS_06715 [Candidatus Sumerlaeia bacterium]